MTERILDFADAAVYLHVRKDQLIVERKDQPEVSTPLCEVAVLALTHPRVLCSQPVMVRLMGHGGALIVCDERHLPVGLQVYLSDASRQATARLQRGAVLSVSERRFPASHSLEQQVETLKRSVSERRFPASHSISASSPGA